MCFIYVLFIFLQLSTNLLKFSNRKNEYYCKFDHVSFILAKTKHNTNIISHKTVFVPTQSCDITEKKNILKKKKRFIFPFKNILIPTNYSELEPSVSLWG